MAGRGNKIFGVDKGLTYHGEQLAGSILLEDGDGTRDDDLGLYGGGEPVQPQFTSARRFFGAELGDEATQTGGLAPRRADGTPPHRTPTRTPSPTYAWNPKKITVGDEDDFHRDEPSPSQAWLRDEKRSSGISISDFDTGNPDAGARGSEDQSDDLFAGQPYSQPMPFPQTFNPYWSGTLSPQAYYAMMMNNLPDQQAFAASMQDARMPEGDAAMWQMMMAMQASSLSGLGPQPGQPSEVGFGMPSHPSTARIEEPLPAASQDPRGSGGAAEGRRSKPRPKEFGAARATPDALLPRDRGGKGERRRKGEEAAPSRCHKAKPSDHRHQSSSPIIEQLKMRDKPIELADLTWHIGEIAQDQYGSRLIQQKLEVASDEEKEHAFKSVLQKMPQLTTDVFGNYVIQKFFEHGDAEQRRIMAEQLVGQVLKMSLQMYGCRVVQKAIDSVQIEQQCLLVSELRGHVLKCIEDQHGNHVIQKCIERLPTDKINFIVDAFEGQASRMAKHCHGCRVIQRLIEYCSSMQISGLLDEVLRFSMELATDQYGNYVVQHVMEHSSRPGDRNAILHIVYKNILSLSCHKYASNVVEKALSCGTSEEKASVVMAMVGEKGGMQPPLLTMMRDRFGNYIVQRTIGVATGASRGALIHSLQEQMPVLKKSNTYGKHIISALERAQPL